MCGSISLFEVFEEVEGDGNDGTKNDEQDDDLVIRVDEGNIAQEVSQRGKADGPKKTTQKVVGHKRRIVHLGSACFYGGKSADKGHEAGQNYGFGSVLFIEFLGSNQVMLFEK